MQATSKLIHSTKNSLINKQKHLYTGLRKPVGSSNNTIERSMSIRRSYKFKNNAKAYSSDNNTNHSTQTTTICDQQDCENKQCNTVCDIIKLVKVDGHYTHNPPQNVQSIALCNQDYNGNNKKQSFVKTTNTNDTITTENLKELTEEDMVQQAAATAYSNIPNIYNIIDKFIK